MTPMGEGRVVQILPLQQSVIVDVPNVGPRQFTKEALDRAEKIQNGESVPALPVEEPESEVIVSRPEDQEVSRKNRTNSLRRRGKKSSSNKRRGRRSRRSNKDKK